MVKPSGSVSKNRIGDVLGIEVGGLRVRLLVRLVFANRNHCRCRQGLNIQGYRYGKCPLPEL